MASHAISNLGVPTANAVSYWEDGLAVECIRASTWKSNIGFIQERRLYTDLGQIENAKLQELEQFDDSTIQAIEPACARFK